MNNNDMARERRKQRRLEALGTNEPRCATCGETDWRVIEQHHVADHGRDSAMVLECPHLPRADVGRTNPRAYMGFNPNAEPMLDRIGHFLLGLADMLRIIVAKLYEFGRALIERASIEGAVS
jgi:hypothetical protein